MAVLVVAVAVVAVLVLAVGPALFALLCRDEIKALVLPADAVSASTFLVLLTVAALFELHTVLLLIVRDATVIELAIMFAVSAIVSTLALL